MKKTLACVVSITFLSASLTSPAIGAIKAGTTCTKAGSTSTAAGKKFTCIKLGKKLVWNKGVLVSKPVAQPSPVATQTAVPSPTPVAQEQSKESPKVERASTVGIENLNAKNVYDRSRQEVNDAIEKSSYVNALLNFNIGPNQDPASISAEKESLNKAARLWSSIYQPKEQLEVLFYNFVDLDWAKAKYKQLTGNETFHSSDSCSKNYCGNASAGRTGSGPWIYEQGMGGSLWNKSTSAHEYTHLAQTSGNSNYWNIAPIWLVEGMAQFYGEAIGYMPFDSKLKTRGEMHRQNASDFRSAIQGDLKKLLEKNDPSTIKALMQSVEFPNPRHGQATTAGAYLLGSYASEVLVAVYGHVSVEQFIHSFGNSTDWKSNFFKSFGISPDDFYLKLAPYLYEMSKEL